MNVPPGAPDRAPAVADPPEAPPVSSLKLVLTLGIAGALAGLLLVTVHEWTQPRILAHREAVLRDAVLEVLGDPAAIETLHLVDGRLVREAPEQTGASPPERVFRGADAAGGTVGYAIVAGEPGFQDVVRVIFGYDPATGRVLGMRVLESKETPGLGDKIEKDREWVALFDGATAPLHSVKPGRGTGAPGEIDTITGATISSSAVVRIIQNAIDRTAPLLESIEVPESTGGGGS